MTDFSDLTIFVPTANRPDQLYRAIRYYVEALAGSGATLMIADGSDLAAARRFDVMVDGTGLSNHFAMIRYGNSLPFFDRVAAALAMVTTPYVMIAADDDFYFIEWIDEALQRMRVDHDREYVAQVGNYFVFDLLGFRAFGEVGGVADGSPERHPVPYLEGTSIVDRVGEIAAISQGISTIAWYALHRTGNAVEIFAHVAGRGLPMLLAERYFSVAQAASGRTHFSPGIFLARQADGDLSSIGWRSEPPGLDANRDAVAATLACTQDYMELALDLAPEEAKRLTERAFANEIAMMAQADRRRFARRFIGRLRLRRLLTALRRPRGAYGAPLRDRRLPQRCDPAEMAAKAQIVRDACRPDLLGFGNGETSS